MLAFGVVLEIGPESGTSKKIKMYTQVKVLNHGQELNLRLKTWCENQQYLFSNFTGRISIEFGIDT